MDIKCGSCGRVGKAQEMTAMARYKCSYCNIINEVTNIELREWLGFNYNGFVQYIEKFITQDQFKALKADNELEALAGKFNESQIDKLKSILKISFKEGLSIRDIKNKITKEIDVKDLREIKDGEVTDKVLLSANRRPLMIARTESTRVAAEGALLNYKDNDIQEVAWLSSTGVRTCDVCNDLNGKIMSVYDARGQIPKHVYCRCTYIPIVK